jgi:7-cyano-7-deazaguanine reductase
MINELTPEQSELGKKSPYISQYDRSKLFPISRQIKRELLGLTDALPFFGFDLWNHYEVSWLNPKGKPMVAVAEIRCGCDSKYLIESKSMKLYFNSFNNTIFPDKEALEATIQADLNQHLQGSFLQVAIKPLAELQVYSRLAGISLDELDIECSSYHTEPAYLTTEEEWVEEKLCSDLLKSNCLVTNQPDWCSVYIHYRGLKINHVGLLRYLVSFRNDNEFHEHCIEKIFMHLYTRCKPEMLTVYGRSTRRGGIDINSYRSTEPVDPSHILNERLCRQ